MSIQVLAPNVIDQIAAGEVVERPAHLVKELLENALDAGATEITVDFSNGGRRVRVEDNGSGIAAEDLPMAVARHATSKITRSDDLFRLSTFGFRGEALASIGAVSNLVIDSRVAGDEIGSRIRVNGGNVSSVESIGRSVGTTVDVEDLFSNIPARLKFLKSATHETTQIKNVIKAAALSNPAVTIRVKNENKLIAVYPAEDNFLKRACTVLEESEIYFGEHTTGHFKCRVAISSPHRTVKQSRQIWLFVQGRWVQDRALQAAVMDAYRNLLMHGEYPIAVVDLQCATSEVDVNVSPNKSQVKFVDSSNAFRSVNQTVRKVLESAPWLGEMASQVKPYSASTLSADRTDNRPVAEVLQTAFSDSVPSSPFQSTVFQKRDFDLSSGFNLDSFKSAVQSVPAVGFRWSNVGVIGQTRLTYILCENDDGLIVVDQHAAHERVLFERLSLGYRSGGMEIQQYLLPLTVQLSEDFIAVLLTHSNDLEKMGIHAEQFGPETLAVTAGPAILTDDAILKALEKQAHEYVERGGSFHLEKVIGDLMATAACHSAIRAGRPLSIEEMKALLTQMDEFPLSGFCPHGRPVYVRWNLSEIERDFGRIV